MTALARPESMSSAFAKWFIDQPAVLHRFTGPDVGEHHDHPFTLDIQVLSGGYVEEVLDPDTLAISHVLRQPGDCFTIATTHVHRITRLLDGECWTVARYGPWVRSSGFWRIRDGRAERRVWNEGWVA